MAEAETDNSLTDEQQLFIVQALACFLTPTQVAELVKEEFGITVTRQKVQYYDPTKGKEKGLAAKHKAIFKSTRKAYLAGIGDVGVANLRYRLDKIQGVVERAEAQKGRNDAMVLQALKQAAEDAGGVYTNKRKEELSVKGEISLPMTLKDWKTRAEQRRGQADEAMKAAAGDGAKSD
jgi:hypothetical protein